jgi:hypothetical protein
MIPAMDTNPRDPEALKRRGIIQRVLGGMNLRFPGLFAILATVTVLDILIPDFIPFIDEIILALLTMLFALWKDRRLATVTVTKSTGGPPLPPSQPPLPPTPPEAR